MITDLELQVTNPDILLFPPSEEEKILTTLLKKRDIYAKVMLRPMLMLDAQKHRMPVKTIPSHFAQFMKPVQAEVAEIFGDEQKDQKYFKIGCPLDMTTPVCLDLIVN